MRRRITKRSAWVLGVVFLLAWAAGCGSQRSHQDFIPSQERAQQALDTALAAWKKGQRAGRIETDGMKVQVVDSKWQAGQRLAGYQILGAEPGDGPTWFSVRLTLKEPAGDQQVRYVVLGLDPLWVYRQEDFAKTESHAVPPSGRK